MCIYISLLAVRKFFIHIFFLFFFSFSTKKTTQFQRLEWKSEWVSDWIEFDHREKIKNDGFGFKEKSVDFS